MGVCPLQLQVCPPLEFELGQEREREREREKHYSDTHIRGKREVAAGEECSPHPLVILECSSSSSSIV